MKTLKNFGKLCLIWFISITSLCAAIAAYQINPPFSASDFFGTMVIFMVYSFFCSLPAFIFFSVLSMQVLKQNWSLAKKRGYMLLINYADIAGTGLVFFGFTFRGFHEISAKFVQFYPCWALVIASTAAILLMPFGNQPSPTASNHKLNNI